LAFNRKADILNWLTQFTCHIRQN